MAHLSTRAVSFTSKAILEALSRTGAPAPAVRTVNDLLQANSTSLDLGFTDVHMPDGIACSPPKADPFEMRKSIILEFSGIRSQQLHIFEDGSLKLSETLQQAANVRKTRHEYLTAKENWYPGLGQTPVRERAFRNMIREMYWLRKAESLPLDAKEMGKMNAIKRFEDLLDEQKRERLEAKAELQGRKVK